MATTMLLEAVQRAAEDLDTTNRAWVIGIGRLVDNEDSAIISTEQISEVLAHIHEEGDFPLGPLAYAPEFQRSEVNPIYHMVTVEHHKDEKPYLESKIGFGIAGFVAQGFTRSGILDDDECEPSHVLLVDVEAAISDITTLLVAVALKLGYRGPCALLVGVASDVPGRPLRLRAYDPSTGDLLPVTEAPTEFTPVAATFMVTGEPDRVASHKMCYGMAIQAADQFGVDGPQLFLDPKYGTPKPGTMGVAPPSNPFEFQVAAATPENGMRPTLPA